MLEMGAKFDEGWSVEKETKPSLKKEYKSYAKHQLYFTKQMRKGKVVTIVQPFYVEKKELQGILKKLKKKLATGGSLKEDTLEFQGEVREALQRELKIVGFSMRG